MSDTVRLDVRDSDAPFPEITSALEELGDDERLLLINSFEPEPLYEVVENRGYTYETTEVSPEEYHVTIERG